MKQSAADARAPAVLVIGLPGSGKTAFIRRYAGPSHRIVAVDDAEALGGQLRRSRRGRPVVVEARGLLEPLDAIDVFAERWAAQHFYLSDVVAVVDARRFLPAFDEAASDEGSAPTAAERLVNAIELASAVALENTGGLCDRADEARILGVIRALNPTARLDGATWDSSPALDLSLVHRDARWLSIPPRGPLAVDVFKYQARRPFDPARLAAVLEAGWAGVLRTKGFVWIATRGDERGVYVQAGQTWRLDGAGPWWASVPQDEWPDSEAELADIRGAWNIRTGDRRQELVFVGVNLSEDRIRRDLDACLIGPRAYAAGAAAWGALPDPLPSWDDQTWQEPTPAPASPQVQTLAVRQKT